MFPYARASRGQPTFFHGGVMDFFLECTVKDFRDVNVMIFPSINIARIVEENKHSEAIHVDT